VATNSLHHEDQEQIMAVASYVSPVSPAALRGPVCRSDGGYRDRAGDVDRLVMAVDSGVIVNPITASGQVEGGMTQALGYAVCEEMVYDEQGQARERDLRRLSYLPWRTKCPNCRPSLSKPSSHLTPLG
jgi:putative selenate reductase molybdopterin-binding subunit